MENGLNDKQPEKWYFKTISLIVSILLVGPFALPLVWKNKRFSRNTKIIITAIVLILTIWLTVVSFKTLGLVADSYKQMQNMYDFK